MNKTILYINFLIQMVYQFKIPIKLKNIVESIYCVYVSLCVSGGKGVIST